MKFKTYSVVITAFNRDEKLFTLSARSRREVRNIIAVEYPTWTIVKIHLEK